MNVVTDLLDKLVIVSMWITKDPPEGEMVPLITGIVRAVGATSDCFTILVQTQITHRGSRKVGALTMFSLGPRGGVEVVPVDPNAPVVSPRMLQYRALEGRLRRVRADKASDDRQDVILAEMEGLWWKLSLEERDAVDGEGATCDAPKSAR